MHSFAQLCNLEFFVKKWHIFASNFQNSANLAIVIQGAFVAERTKLEQMLEDVVRQRQNAEALVEDAQRAAIRPPVEAWVEQIDWILNNLLGFGNFREFS